MRLLKLYISRLAVLIIAAFSIPVISCDLMHEDLRSCPSGARLRFVYDYNMEFANAFSAQVDCLTLIVYDKNGSYLQTLTADRQQISDENWRMEIDLPAGEYQFLAYGGISCTDASFGFVLSPGQTSVTELRVSLYPNMVTSPIGRPLHPLFYGTLDIEIPDVDSDSDYVDATVYLKKDTNDIRILLANLNQEPISEDDFEFNLITDNTLLNYKNDIIPTSATTYYP